MFRMLVGLFTTMGKLLGEMSYEVRNFIWVGS